jgi:hypothetical protein
MAKLHVDSGYHGNTILYGFLRMTLMYFNRLFSLSMDRSQFLKDRHSQMKMASTLTHL